MFQAYKAEFLKKWNDNQLDAVIAPGFPFPASPVGKTLEVMGKLLLYQNSNTEVLKVTCRGL